MNNITKINKYVALSLISKLLVALCQILVIYIIAKVHTPSESTIIFLLIGYGTWLVLFEAGLSQSLQNNYNQKKIDIKDMELLIIVHFLGMLLLFALINCYPFLPKLLFPTSINDITNNEFKAFTLGISLIILSTNSIILQKTLLILNKGIYANIILIIQSVIIIIGLLFYYIQKNNSLMFLILIYFTPPVIINSYVIFKDFFGTVNKDNYSLNGIKKIIKNSPNFFLINLLGTIFLGCDYFYAAHFLANEEIAQYHILTRFFFISYIVYYSFIQFSTKNLSIEKFYKHKKLFLNKINQSLLCGVLCVTAIFITFFVLNKLQVISTYFGIYNVDLLVLLQCYLYYLIRVFRDILLVILINIDMKKTMLKINLFELIIAITLLSITVKSHGINGIFFSMMIACILSILILIFSYKKNYANNTINNNSNKK